MTVAAVETRPVQRSVGGQALCLLVTLLLTPANLLDVRRPARLPGLRRDPLPPWKEALAARRQWASGHLANSRRPTR